MKAVFYNGPKDGHEMLVPVPLLTTIVFPIKRQVCFLSAHANDDLLERGYDEVYYELRSAEEDEDGNPVARYWLR